MTAFLLVLVIALAAVLLAVVTVARCKIAELEKVLKYCDRYMTQYEQENGELKAVIHEAAAKLAGKARNAVPGGVIDTLIGDVLLDLCEQEDKWEP